MRILICHRPGGAFGYITDAWINALQMVSDFEVDRWNGQLQSWNRFKPDLYLGCSGHRQPVPAPDLRRNCKIAIHVNPYGPIEVKPSINERPEAIKWVKSTSPDAVYGYGLEKDRKYWEYWDRDGIPWIPMACAGDATKFNPLAGDHSLDVVYVGGRWDYKAKSLDPFLLPVLRDRGLTKAHYGWGAWPSDIKVSRVSEELMPATLASAKVGPCISEPHTRRYGIDIPERVFKVALSGTVAVHDPIANLQGELPSVPVEETPGTYLQRIKMLAASDPEALRQKARKQYQQVFEAHTYHHRLAGMLRKLGFVGEAKKLLATLELLRVEF